MPVNEVVVDAVSINNVKTLGEAAAHSTALAFENAVSHQNRMNVIAESAVGNIIKNLTEIDPAQAVSILKATSGNEVAATIAQLAAALAGGQQTVKAAQTTPPPTGGGVPPA